MARGRGSLMNGIGLMVALLALGARLALAAGATGALSAQMPMPGASVQGAHRRVRWWSFPLAGSPLPADCATAATGALSAQMPMPARRGRSARLSRIHRAGPASHPPCPFVPCCVWEDWAGWEGLYAQSSHTSSIPACTAVTSSTSRHYPSPCGRRKWFWLDVWAAGGAVLRHVGHCLVRVGLGNLLPGHQSLAYVRLLPALGLALAPNSHACCCRKKERATPLARRVLRGRGLSCLLLYQPAVTMVLTTTTHWWRAASWATGADLRSIRETPPTQSPLAPTLSRCPTWPATHPCTPDLRIAQGMQSLRVTTSRMWACTAVSFLATCQMRRCVD
jgi:hypothetical protein